MIKLFFTALMFYTRIPCPANTPHSPEALNRATVFFPLIGWIIGFFAGVSFYYCAQYFSTFTAAIISTGITILLTGAFHEDGFADVCDAFGGGWKKEQVLEIMKDSRVGAYGAIGISLLLLLKIALIDDTFFIHGYLRDELWTVTLIFMSAHSISRFSACSIIYFGDYARANDDTTSKSKPIAKQFPTHLFIISGIFALAPIALLAEISYSPQYWLILIPVVLITWRAMTYFKSRIGGYTGDCLGATQQLSEVACYAMFAALL